MADKPVRSDKVATVAELTDLFRGSTATLLTEYRGLTMSQMTTLRRNLGRETTYEVSKNTLAKRAAADAGISGIDDLLVGPTAIAFVGGDPVEAAKGLRDFAKAHPLLVLKGGVLDGRALSADEVRKLADLESREVLLAKLAGAMKGNLSKAVGLFQAPLSQVARLAAALQEKKAAEPQPAAAVTEEAAPAVAEVSEEAAAPAEDSTEG
jgi:large subunit ribosomal protein L10